MNMSDYVIICRGDFGAPEVYVMTGCESPTDALSEYLGTDYLGLFELASIYNRGLAFSDTNELVAGYYVVLDLHASGGFGVYRLTQPS